MTQTWPRHFQFSIRTLLLLVAIAAIGVAVSQANPWVVVGFILSIYWLVLVTLMGGWTSRTVQVPAVDEPCDLRDATEHE